MSNRATLASPDSSNKSRSWLQVVDTVRRKTEHEQHRFRILSGITGWQEFVSAWCSNAICAMKREYPVNSKYEGPLDIDMMNYWAWSEIEITGAVDTALEIVNDAATISSLQVITCFDAMRSSAILYPDGSINPHVIQHVSDEVQSDMSRVAIRSTQRLIKNIQSTAALKNLTQKHGG